MIIIGFGKKTLKFFAVLPSDVCGRCHNNAERKLIKRTTWLTLFFIPILPYYTEYLIACPICNNLQKISKEDFYKIIESPQESYAFKDTLTSEQTEEIKYAGKTPTQISYLKELEEFRSKKNIEEN